MLGLEFVGGVNSFFGCVGLAISNVDVGFRCFVELVDWAEKVAPSLISIIGVCELTFSDTLLDIYPSLHKIENSLVSLPVAITSFIVLLVNPVLGGTPPKIDQHSSTIV